MPATPRLGLTAFTSRLDLKAPAPRQEAPAFTPPPCPNRRPATHGRSVRFRDGINAFRKICTCLGKAEVVQLTLCN